MRANSMLLTFTQYADETWRFSRPFAVADGGRWEVVAAGTGFSGSGLPFAVPASPRAGTGATLFLVDFFFLNLPLRRAKKPYDAHGGVHVCRQCSMCKINN
jgi:hypothetical protein